MSHWACSTMYFLLQDRSPRLQSVSESSSRNSFLMKLHHQEDQEGCPGRRRNNGLGLGVPPYTLYTTCSEGSAPCWRGLGGSSSGVGPREHGRAGSAGEDAYARRGRDAIAVITYPRWVIIRCRKGKAPCWRGLGGTRRGRPRSRRTCLNTSPAEEGRARVLY